MENLKTITITNFKERIKKNIRLYCGEAQNFYTHYPIACKRRLEIESPLKKLDQLVLTTFRLFSATDQ